MAQAEDTELRDLVIEALEKNGSLAKIRALLRANIFLAFEDDCENIKQNMSLDKVLKLPEGILSLSIVHEFLEYCNLKNTLFVYMSESRQRKEYVYEGQKNLAEKLNVHKRDNISEPILVTLVKNILKSCQRKFCDPNDVHTFKSHDKDDQNSTYIVHDDSGSATSNSNSDNSSDGNNKLHLRLQLDNSDTDTSSSDSARDKSSSEYIPNEHIVIGSKNAKADANKFIQIQHKTGVEAQGQKSPLAISTNKNNLQFLHDLQLVNNSSSDSTSYVELKSYNPLNKKLFNTTGVPFIEEEKETSPDIVQPEINLETDIQTPKTSTSNMNSVSSGTLSSSSMKYEDDNKNSNIVKNITEESARSEAETAEYSYDFTSSPVAKINLKQAQSPESTLEDLVKSPKKNTSSDQHQNSVSSQSSVSISDVADLISEKSISYSQHTKDNKSSDKSGPIMDESKKLSKNEQNKLSDDSGDFSESPIPSLSNLSLDIHSD